MSLDTAMIHGDLQSTLEKRVSSLLDTDDRHLLEQQLIVLLGTVKAAKDLAERLSQIDQALMVHSNNDHLHGARQALLEELARLNTSLLVSEELR